MPNLHVLNRKILGKIDLDRKRKIKDFKSESGKFIQICQEVSRKIEKPLWAFEH